MKDPIDTHGTIVLGNAAGRALRKAPADVRGSQVLYCSGGFRDGDAVYVTFRGEDGGQAVIATAIVRCDEAELRRRIEARADESATPGGVADDIVASQADVVLLWPPA